MKKNNGQEIKGDLSKLLTFLVNFRYIASIVVIVLATLILIFKKMVKNSDTSIVLKPNTYYLIYTNNSSTIIKGLTNSIYCTLKKTNDFSELKPLMYNNDYSKNFDIIFLPQRNSYDIDCFNNDTCVLKEEKKVNTYTSYENKLSFNVVSCTECKKYKFLYYVDDKFLIHHDDWIYSYSDNKKKHQLAYIPNMNDFLGVIFLSESH